MPWDTGGQDPDGIAALLDAKREKNIEDWYDRDEWQRRKLMEAQEDRSLTAAELEPQAAAIFGSGEGDDALLSAWYRRPDAERKKVMGRFGTTMTPAELERRALGMFPV
jgi:hypothetical protein